MKIIMLSVISKTRFRKWIGLLFPVLFVAMVLGCSGKKEVKNEPAFRKWKIMAEESKAHSPSKRARTIDLSAADERGMMSEEHEKAAPERPLPTQKITMTMRNTDVNVILRALARAADQNIMLNDEVKGITNVEVIDTPWDQVFRGILRTRGLT